MIFETLNDNVVLVELSGEEMEKFHITYDLLDNKNEKMEIAIKSLIHEIDVEKRLSKGEKVIVEAMPTEEGGCFFIFTFTRTTKKKYKLKRKESFLIFQVNNVDDLLDFISAITKANRNDCKCEIFNMENEYFMVISDYDEKIKAVVCEYGDIYTNINYARLKEYGKSVGNVYLQ